MLDGGQATRSPIVRGNTYISSLHTVWFGLRSEDSPRPEK